MLLLADGTAQCHWAAVAVVVAAAAAGDGGVDGDHHITWLGEELPHSLRLRFT